MPQKYRSRAQLRLVTAASLIAVTAAGGALYQATGKPDGDERVTVILTAASTGPALIEWSLGDVDDDFPHVGGQWRRTFTGIRRGTIAIVNTDPRNETVETSCEIRIPERDRRSGPKRSRKPGRSVSCKLTT